MLVCTAPFCTAGVIVFSSLSGGSYAPSNSWGVLNLTGLAFPFAAEQTAELTAISVPVLSLSLNAEYTLSLYADASGSPGTALDTFTFANPVAPSGGTMTTVMSVLHPALVSGTSYWLSLENTAGANNAFWYFGYGAGSLALRSLPAGSWTVYEGAYTAAAMGITGEASGGSPAVFWLVRRART